MELKVVWLTIFATTLSSASSSTAVAPTTNSVLTSTTTTALTTDPAISAAAQSSTTQTSTVTSAASGGSSGSTSTVTSAASGGSSGSTMTPADSSSAAASPDVCYEFILKCSASSDKSECFNTHTESNAYDICDRNGSYCMITSNENGTGTIFQTQCVNQDCDRSEVSSDTGGVITSNCCDTSRCNVHTLLNAGSAVIPGVLLLLLLAAAAAAVAGTNIVT